MNTQLFTTLSHPNRLDIVELLRSKPRPVNEIVQKLQLNQPQVSKHLKTLADAGMVRAKPVANQRIYELQPQRFKELDVWLEKYRRMWEKRFDRLDALLMKNEKLRKKGGVQ